LAEEGVIALAVIASEAKQPRPTKEDWIASSLRSQAQTLALVAGNDG
jgi:hypothetical protein